ncbi:putative ydg sra domain-containing protein [Diaporthe ampelina]|uniref:Putative ydg sra domain-containing protein n=1 Tax=Diaporthe ampelina TaxID=1214573 RepID=A0A0G2FEA7_9PEZI|nr:putative ydg sra domain-containing protein [Diaporthe ampelina]
MPQDVLRVPPGQNELRWTKQQAWRIEKVIEEYRSSRGNPISRDGQDKLAFLRKQFFPYLRFDIRMTPDIKRYSKIDVRLQEIIQERRLLPQDLVATAELLLQKFENEGWGASQGNRRPSVTEGGPPADHPIWGVDGIMHGAKLVTEGRKPIYVIDDRYRDEMRNARVFGDNGLTPGDWFPRMVIAQFKGAHSGGIRGISGDPERGAYSVVVSGQYDEDLDEGDVLYYSGEAADKNENPREVIRRSTNDSLVESCGNRQPVRVLRSASKGERERHYAPACGIRYDGLYSVVAFQNRTNAKGGLYQRFKLRRLPGQEDLDDIVARSPTAEQKREFQMLKEGY